LNIKIGETTGILAFNVDTVAGYTKKFHVVASTLGYQGRSAELTYTQTGQCHDAIETKNYYTTDQTFSYSTTEDHTFTNIGLAVKNALKDVCDMICVVQDEDSMTQTDVTIAFASNLPTVTVARNVQAGFAISR